MAVVTPALPRGTAVVVAAAVAVRGATPRRPRHRSAIFTIRALSKRTVATSSCAASGLRSAVFGLASGRTRTIDHLPVGARCHVDEVGTAGATQSTVGPRSTVTIPAGAAASVTAVNRFDAGTLQVRTVVPNWWRRTHRTISVYVLCRLAGGSHFQTFPLPHGGYERIRSGGSLLLRHIPARAGCSVQPLTRQLALSARVSRQVVVRAARRSTLTITDHSLTKRYWMILRPAGASARAGDRIGVRPDDRVVISTRHARALHTSVTVMPNAGLISVLNTSGRAVSAALGHGRSVARRTRIPSHGVAMFNTQ